LDGNPDGGGWINWEAIRYFEDSGKIKSGYSRAFLASMPVYGAVVGYDLAQISLLAKPQKGDPLPPPDPAISVTSASTVKPWDRLFRVVHQYLTSEMVESCSAKTLPDGVLYVLKMKANIPDEIRAAGGIRDPQTGNFTPIATHDYLVFVFDKFGRELLCCNVPLEINLESPVNIEKVVETATSSEEFSYQDGENRPNKAKCHIGKWHTLNIKWKERHNSLKTFITEVFDAQSMTDQKSGMSVDLIDR
jgi:hypothetical protein